MRREIKEFYWNQILILAVKWINDFFLVTRNIAQWIFPWLHPVLWYDCFIELVNMSVMFGRKELYSPTRVEKIWMIVCRRLCWRRQDWRLQTEMRWLKGISDELQLKRLGCKALSGSGIEPTMTLSGLAPAGIFLWGEARYTKMACKGCSRVECSAGWALGGRSFQKSSKKSMKNLLWPEATGVGVWTCARDTRVSATLSLWYCA